MSRPHNRPTITREEILSTVHAMERHTSKAAAARSLGMSETTFRRIYDLRHDLESRGGIANDNLQHIIEGLRSELDMCRRSLADAVRPRFTIRTDNACRSEAIKVLVIGDAHDSPHIPDKSRFEWIGSHINASKPDVVVQIGDFASIDSLNTHEANHTAKGRKKPTFSEDMISFNLALQALSSKLNYHPELHCTLGNHERRIWSFQDEHPEMSEDMQFRLFEIFERYKWSVSPYGMITYYGGVGYVHAALNSLGKTYGGKNAEATIANESVHDLSVGHSHRERPWRAAKIGGNNYVVVDNVGCALPDGHIEPYAHHALNGWAYGVVEQIVRHNHIQDRNWISMERLGELYG